MSTPMLPQKKFESPEEKAKAKAKANAKIKNQRSCLQRIHLYAVLIVHILIWSLVIAFVFWLFLRIPEPELNLRGFRLDGLNGTSLKSSFAHYNITLHNPDLYKRIYYDVLVMRITNSYDYSAYGVTVDFDVDGKGFLQGRMDTDTLPISATNYTGHLFDRGLRSEYFNVSLAEGKWYIQLEFVMQFNVIGFTRQRLRIAEIYFDDYGSAIINPHTGLQFK